MRRAVAWWAKLGTDPAPRAWWLVLFALNMIVCLILGFVIARVISTQQSNSTLAHRLSLDEQATCRIQQGALPASKQLAEGLTGLIALSASSAAAHANPAAATVEISHLSRYLQLEARQPASRSCPTRKGTR